jgi:hypothetical protein
MISTLLNTVFSPCHEIAGTGPLPDPAGIFLSISLINGSSALNPSALPLMGQYHINTA